MKVGIGIVMKLGTKLMKVLMGNVMKVGTRIESWEEEGKGQLTVTAVGDGKTARWSRTLDFNPGADRIIVIILLHYDDHSPDRIIVMILLHYDDDASGLVTTLQFD